MQRLCPLYGSMLLYDQVVPTTEDQGVKGISAGYPLIVIQFCDFKGVFIISALIYAFFVRPIIIIFCVVMFRYVLKGFILIASWVEQDESNKTNRISTGMFFCFLFIVLLFLLS